MPALALLSLVAVLSTRITSVRGYGYVQEVVADGKTYSGYLPYTDPYMSPVRDRIIREPVIDITVIDIQCDGYSAGGVDGSEPAKICAAIEAGSEPALL